MILFVCGPISSSFRDIAIAIAVYDVSLQISIAGLIPKH